MRRELNIRRLSKFLTSYVDGEEEKHDWKDADYTLNYAREVLDRNELDTLPSQAKLKDMGHGGLAKAIFRYHGGFGKFRVLLGEDSGRSPHGQYRDINFALKKAKEVIQDHELETLPCGRDLKKLGHHGLVAAITEYHGGMYKFRKKLGVEERQRQSGLWKDREYVEKETKSFMKDNGYEVLPSAQIMEELGHGDLSAAIKRFHGGIGRFRESLGHKSNYTPRGKLKDFDFVAERILQIMKDNDFDEVPSQIVLSELGNSGLSRAITQYHGGFSAFREQIRVRVGRESDELQLEGMLERYAGGQDA